MARGSWSDEDVDQLLADADESGDGELQVQDVPLKWGLKRVESVGVPEVDLCGVHGALEGPEREVYALYPRRVAVSHQDLGSNSKDLA